LYLTKSGKGHEAKKLDEGLINHYKMYDNKDKGVAIIVEAKGPVSNLEIQSGNVRIFDQIGNAVSEQMPMNFVVSNKGAVSGVAVWDAKNEKGRNVGAGTYLAVVNVSMVFYDRSSRVERSYRKMIQVKVGE
jgi:hypothetical protein